MKKTKIMKPETTHYEILLFTGNSFSRSICCLCPIKDHSQKLNPVAQIEKACWAGMLFEMLPEITGSSYVNRDSFIWDIMKSKNFLRISLGPTPTITGNETALDPYFYMLSAIEN